MKIKKFSSSFFLLALFFVSTTAAGIYINYSIVPFYDSWHGIIDFYSKIENGASTPWFDQHNEHRIILSRILFWLELNFFGATGKFLLVCNFLLAALNCIVLCCFLKEMLADEQYNKIKYIAGCIIVCLIFSWTQKENFAWEFQSQFFLAQALPLLSFFAFYKSTQERARSSSFYFLSSCLLGILACGTMANGVMVLPILLLLSLLIGLKPVRIIAILFLTLLTFYFYFANYSSPSQHGSVGKTLTEQPLNFLIFIPLYLGGFIHYLNPWKEQILRLIGGGIALAAGIGFIWLSFLYALRAFQKRKNIALELSLLAYVLYVGGTAFATAGGRLKFGLNAAISERYATPVLTAWCVLLILSLPWIVRKTRENGSKALIAIFLVLLLFIPAQLRALKNQNEVVFSKKVAALAFALHINDSEKTNIIYPSVNLDVMRPIVDYITAKKIFVFGTPDFIDIEKNIGTKNGGAKRGSCELRNVKLEPLADSKFQGVNGLVLAKNYRKPSAIELIDTNGIVVGYAFANDFRPVLQESLSVSEKYFSFEGYIQTERAKKFITDYANHVSCIVKIDGGD